MKAVVIKRLKRNWTFMIFFMLASEMLRYFKNLEGFSYYVTYIKRTILVVKYEGLNGELIKKRAKYTVSNDSKIDVFRESSTNLVMV